MKKKILLLLAVASLVFFACSSDEAETADLQGGLYLLAKDANNGQALAGVSVTLLSNGQTKTTDAQGKVSFEGIAGGLHPLRIEKEGYATLEGVHPILEVLTLGSTIVEVGLFKLSATLTGSLYYWDDKWTMKPATGATVRVTFDDDKLFAKKIIEATVGADGKYSLPMPAVPNVYKVEALAYTIGEVKYEQVAICGVVITSCPDLTASGNSVTNLEDGGYYYIKSFAGEFRVLESTIELEDSTSAVVLHFTDSIDIAKSKRIKVSASKSSGAVLATEITYSDGNKTVTIAPLAAKWAADPYIKVEVVSGKGREFSQNIHTIFKIEEVKLSGVVKDLRITTASLPSSTLGLEWTEFDGATSYNVFIRAVEVSKAYVQVDESCFSTSTSNKKVTATINSTCNPLTLEAFTDTVSFVVQAYNKHSKTQTTLADVTPAKLNPAPPVNITGVTPVCTFTHVGIDEADGPYPSGVNFECNAIAGAVSYQVYAKGNGDDKLIYDGGHNEESIWFSDNAPNTSIPIHTVLGFSDENIFLSGNIKIYVKATGGGTSNVSNPSVTQTFPSVATGVPQFYIEQDGDESDNLVFKFKPIMGASKYIITISFNSGSPLTIEVPASEVNAGNPYWYEASKHVGSSNISSISTMKIVAVDSFNTSSQEKTGSL